MSKRIPGLRGIRFARHAGKPERIRYTVALVPEPSQMNDLNARELRFFDFSPADRFLADVLNGLAATPKSIPPKYFYDERGSQLFEAICELPEYYLTRAETSLMHTHAKEMARLIGGEFALIEYGSGASRKTRILIEAARPVLYMPVDISRDSLSQSTAKLASDYPWLKIWAVWGDYSRPLALPKTDSRLVIFFPGSTIGNFTTEEALAFLKNCKDTAGAGGGMLVGVDLKKSRTQLDAAYDDAQGVTAAFNLNLLARINRELAGSFGLEGFLHRAFYDAALSRIEMHLVSKCAQRVNVAGHEFEFREGETIHTENSYKYSVAEFQELARASGFRPVSCWADALFSIHYLAAA
jgi:dimethylhistidine N-methyltransferase